MLDRELMEKEHKLKGKYRKRLNKKKQGKPLPVQIIMDRTFHSAFAVLALIDGIPWTKLTFEMYFLCNDLGFQKYVRRFDSQLELAHIDPEKFIFGLHKFYNDIVNDLKKENKYYEFAQFLGAIMQLQFEKKKVLTTNIVDAYVSLILQTLEYLRPNKFDLDVYPYGVSTSGEILVGPYPLAYSDLPETEFEEVLERGVRIDSQEQGLQILKKLYAKHGMTINSPDDIDVLQQTQMIHCNTATAMFPLINEFTFDIATTTAFSSTNIPFEYMGYTGPDIEAIKESLRIRNRTLPTNGVKFEVTDSANEIHSVLLKEIVYNGTVHMLYKIEMFESSLSGYYNTLTGFLYSIMRDAKIIEPFQKLSVFVLSLYATQTLRKYSLDEINNWFFNAGSPLKFRVFGKAGKLQDVYHQVDSKGYGKRDPEKYEREERQISVIIRNLPEGRRASEEAKELAAQYGYELEEGQTFVRPFVRQVFVRKDKKD